VSVLLRQPHGFEGLARIVISVPLDDLSFPEAPDRSTKKFNGGGTACDRCVEPGERDEFLARFDELLLIDADTLEGREPVRAEAAHACVTTEVAFSEYVREATDELEFNLGVRHLQDALDVGLIESAAASLNYVNLLLRHRPRSIPQAQESA
jgi:hypothetical protein